MRILITGGSSYLGQHLVPLAAAGHEVRYTFFSRDPLGLANGQHLDVRDRQAVVREAAEFRPQAIIHIAGSNRGGDVTNTIEQGAANVVAAASEVGARLIHLSSDALFDGRGAPYRESAPPSPIHAYGRAKAAAESVVASYPNHVIVRTSLIYSLNLMDHFTEWMATHLRLGQPITLFDDQIRNPVWAITLSEACLELASLGYCGVLNVAGRQALSRAEFGLRLLDWWGIAERGSLTIGPTGEVWPSDCRLDLNLAARILTTPLLGVDEVISRAQRY